MSKNKHLSYNDIPDYQTDWNADPTNDNKPFAGQSTQKFLKQELKKSYGFSRIDGGSMQFFRSAEDADAYDAGDTTKLLHQDDLSGSASIEFRFLDMPSGNVYINGDKPYQFPLYVKSVAKYQDGTEEPYDSNVSLALTVTLNGRTTTTDLGSFPANRAISFNVTPYVANGATFAVIASNDTGNRRTSSRYTVVRANMALTTQNDTWWAQAFRQGDQEWVVPLQLDANVACELRATLIKDGVTYVSRTIPSSMFSAIFAMHLGTDERNGHPLYFGGTAGIYTLHLELVPTDESLSSMERPSLDYQVICIAQDEEDSYLVVNNVSPELQNYTNSHLFDYAVFTGRGNHTLTIAPSVGGTPIGAPVTVATQNGATGTYSLALEQERIDDADFTVDVALSVDETLARSLAFTATNRLGYAATAGASLLIRESGRSNSEQNRDKMTNEATNRTITPTWTGMTWSGVDGHLRRNVVDRQGESVELSVLRLLSGERCEIPVQPLKMSQTQGRTLEILFQPRNVMDYGTTVIQCLDQKDGSYTGLKVTASNVELFTDNHRNGDTQNKNFDPADIIHLAVVVNPAYGEAGRTFPACFIYINGVKQRVFAYDRDINVSGHLLLGSDDADLDVFSIRAYDKALTSDELVANAVNWQPSAYDKAYMKEHNNVKENGRIDFNKVRSLCNVFVFKSADGLGKIPALGMGKKDTITGVLKTYWLEHADWDSEIDCDMAGQGTSSMEYLRWNMKTSTSAPWLFCGERPAIKKWCAKKNFASPMQSHKMGGTEAYDYLARACGAVEGDAPRQAIWQYPFVGFAEDKNGSLSFIGLYTIGPDKGDKDTFGFTSDSIAMEGLDNDRLSTNFRCPWNDNTVSPDEDNEKYEVCGESAWEDAMKNPTGVKNRWMPAYNLVYACSQLIRPWKGATVDGISYPATVQGLLAFGAALPDIDTSTSQGQQLYKDATMYEYWISGQYDLYRYDPVSRGYVLSYTQTALPVAGGTYTYPLTAVNLSSALCGHGYVVGQTQSGGTTSDILLSTALLADAADDDARNELFKKARLSKFRQEMPAYFNRANAFFHLAWAEFMAATDNLAKNTYPYIRSCSDAQSLVCWRQDDVDTVGPIDNQGKDKKPYCVELEDNYSEYGLPALWVWNGRYSQFWYTLKAAFAEEYETFVRTRFMPAIGYGSSDNLLQRAMDFFYHFYFERAQEYFGAALYNADSVWTYEQAYIYEGSYAHKAIALEQSLGDHYSAEKYWFRMRTIYMMSKYRAGLFAAGQTTDCFATRVGAGTNTYTLTPAIYMYPVVQNGEQALQGPRFWPGENRESWTTEPITTAGDQTFRINGMSYLRDVGNLYRSTLKEGVTVAGAMLRTLMLGNHEAQAADIISRITSVTIDNATSLRLLDLGLLSTLAGTANLSSCQNLRHLYAGETALAYVQLSDGGPLQTLVLGSNITTLQLLGKQMLQTLTVGSVSRLTSVEMQNCNDYTAGRVMDILSGLSEGQLQSLRLSFGTMQQPNTLTSAQVDQLVALGTEDIPTKAFSGYITSPARISGTTYLALEAMNITYVGEVEPEVAIGSRDIEVSGGACTMNSNSQGTFRAQAIPPSIGTPRFRLYQGNAEVAEQDGTASYGGVVLHCDTGLLEVGEVAGDFVLQVAAYVGYVESSRVTVNVRQTIDIGGFTFGGDKTYTATGQNAVTLVPVNANYNVPVTDVDVSVEGGTTLSASVVSVQDMQIRIDVLAIPASTTTLPVVITVTDQQGNVFAQTMNVTVQVLRITSFAISGADSIVTIGSYPYILTDILPQGYNKPVSRMTVTATTADGATLPVQINNDTAFTLQLTSMPEYTQNVTLRAVLTLDNGGTVVASKTVQVKVVSNYDVLDELGVAIMHRDGSFYTAQGWQEAGFSASEANGVAVSDAQTNPNSPHRIVAGTTIINGYIKSELGGNITGRVVPDILSDYDGQGNTELMLSILPQKVSSGDTVQKQCADYSFPDGSAGYMPAISELVLFHRAGGFEILKQIFSVDPGYGSTNGITSSSQASAAATNQSTDIWWIFKSANSDGVDAWNNERGDSKKARTIPFAKARAVPLIKAIDLGLPSGTKWANMNIGASGITDYGLYFSWGNVEGHEVPGTYAFSTDDYEDTAGSSLKASIASSDSQHDAALANLGSPWRMPTKDEWLELFNNCDYEWTALNGINGMKFMKKTDHAVYIFLPASGRKSQNSFYEAGQKSNLWTSTYSDQSVDDLPVASLIWAESSGPVGIGSAAGLTGLPIRPVQ